MRNILLSQFKNEKLEVAAEMGNCTCVWKSLMELWKYYGARTERRTTFSFWDISSSYFFI